MAYARYLGYLTPLGSGSGNPLYNSLAGKIDLEISLDLDNDKNPQIAIKSLKFDGVDMPGNYAIDQISAMINQSILSSMNLRINGRYHCNQITLRDGKITITLDRL